MTIARNEKDRILADVNFAEARCYHFEGDMGGLQDGKRMETWPCPEILLAVHILAQSIRSWISEHGFKSNPPGNGVTLCSVLPLINHCCRNASWCRHSFFNLTARYSYVTLYFLACLRRPIRRDHGACADKTTTSCIAYNTSAEFQGSHTAEDCRCQNIIPQNEDTMLDLISNGHIPLVRATVEKNGNVNLRYVKAEPGMPYTALSHLWSDGLGNQDRNNLPRCQLIKISNFVAYSTPWHRLLSILKHGLGLHTSPQEFAGEVTFWLDVYCVPTPTDERRRRLKRDAISRMTPTYAFASRVLLLDRELLSMDWNVDFHGDGRHLRWKAKVLEVLAYNAVCAWRTRYWTYNEVSLAQETVCQYADVAVPWNRIGYPELDEWPENLHKDIVAELEQALDLVQIGNTSHLISVWNALIDKTSSMVEDIDVIICNMLGIKAIDLMKIPNQDRMKAILASFDELPVDLLLSPPPAYLIPALPATKAADEWRWIPGNPTKRGPVCWTSTPSSGHLQVIPTGLRLSHNEATRGNLYLLWIKRLPSWLKVLDRLEFDFDIQFANSTRKQYRVWIQLLHSPGDTGPSQGRDNICFVFSAECSADRYYTFGASFMILKAEGNTLHAHYYCPLRYGFYSTPRSKDCTDEDTIEVLAHYGFDSASHNSLDLLITCGKFAEKSSRM